MDDSRTTSARRSEAHYCSSGVLLWASTVAFFGAGDSFTTTVGVLSGTAAEAGPIMAIVIEYLGVYGIVPFKLAVIGFAYVAWRILPRSQATAVPLGFCVVGIVVTAWNVHVLI